MNTGVTKILRQSFFGVILLGFFLLWQRVVKALAPGVKDDPDLKKYLLTEKEVRKLFQVLPLQVEETKEEDTGEGSHGPEGE